MYFDPARRPDGRGRQVLETPTANHQRKDPRQRRGRGLGTARALGIDRLLSRTAAAQPLRPSEPLRRL
jgi:hypothetical protein